MMEAHMTFEAGPTSTSVSTPSFGMDAGVTADQAIALLPETAQSRLIALRQRKADLHAAMPSFEDIHDLAATKARHANRIADLTRRKTEGGFGLDASALQVVTERRQLERAEKELTRLSQLKEIRAARWQAAAQLERSVVEWVTSGGVPVGCVVEPVEDAPISELLKKGETINDGVDRYRNRLREFRADAHRVRSSAFPSADVKAKFRQQISQLAETGRPDVDAAIEHFQPVSFAMTTLQSMVHNSEAPAIGFTETIDALGLVCFLFGDQVIARVEAEIDQAADDKSALSEVERQNRLATIMVDALAIERLECALIFAAEAKGEVIDFRADTSAQSVLGVRLITAPYQAPNYDGHAFTVTQPFGGRR
jgi:hypothetical protein